MKLTAKPYFIYFLPVFFILNGYNDYFGFFSVKFIFFNFALISFFVASALFISHKLFSQKEKAILFGFCISIFLLFFGSLFDSWKSLIKYDIFTGYYFVIPLALVLMFLLFTLLRKYNHSLKHAIKYLNIVFFALLIFEIIRFVILEIKTGYSELLIDSRFSVVNSIKQNNLKEDSAKPDIFLLVFDAMPSSKALNEDFGNGNKELDTFFQQNKFYVATEAKSNYDLTVLSVSSMLNMDYITTNEIKKGTGINMYYRSTSSLIDNSLVRILKKENYSIHQFQPLSIFNNKDWNGKLVFGNMLIMNYFYKTFPGRLYRDLAWNFLRIDKIGEFFYMNRVEKIKTDILKTDSLVHTVCSKTGLPKFVYAHYMLPHVPFVFKADGSIRAYNKQLKTNDTVMQKLQLTEQVKYANKKIKDIVTFIKQNNKRNTIIIVMGDHGFKSVGANPNQEFGFQNLNAFYFPGHEYSTLYPTLSPVNTFRIILNNYFSSQLTLVKDSCVQYKFSKQEWEK